MEGKLKEYFDIKDVPKRNELLKELVFNETV